MRADRPILGSVFLPAGSCPARIATGQRIRAGAAGGPHRLQIEFTAENSAARKKLRVSGFALANPEVLNVVKDRVTSPTEREVVSSILTWSIDSSLQGQDR